MVPSLMMACLSFAGCSAEQFVPASYSADAQDVDMISISVRDRRIEVLPSDDGMISMDYFVSGREGYDISLSDGVLAMDAASDKEWTDFIGLKPSASYRRITLHVPEGLIDDLSLSTTNEDIIAEGLDAAGSVSLASNGADILIEAVSVGDTLSLSAKNGDIRGSIHGSYEEFSIHADTKKGECNLSYKEDGVKTLAIYCNNGDVDIAFI